MKIEQKLKAQVKTKFYYVFWGTATLSVFAGQMYVGSGYRQMSESLNDWLYTSIAIILQKKMREERGYYMPMPTYPQDGVIR